MLKTLWGSVGEFEIDRDGERGENNAVGWRSMDMLFCRTPAPGDKNLCRVQPREDGAILPAHQHRMCLAPAGLGILQQRGWADCMAMGFGLSSWPLLVAGCLYTCFVAFDP